MNIFVVGGNSSKRLEMINYIRSTIEHLEVNTYHDKMPSLEEFVGTRRLGQCIIVSMPTIHPFSHIYRANTDRVYVYNDDDAARILLGVYKSFRHIQNNQPTLDNGFLWV
jgi:hypothetical protein